MTREEILEKITGIFREELENDDIVLSAETTADDVEEWDSLSHIQLIVAIEKAFKKRFTSSEIQSWNNLGELMDSLEAKL
ncbi:acyl carrier protein [Halpernia humi]|uniref:Acyl carrier protein n=1 Tax=Halpernia humi TaxID=493375 RepID=A0A1H5W6R3_9FLAO|nr:acyl carrier protein [Halpernia humi]SEF95172.1 acyl carrier protein [Halpernia humi]